MKSKIQQPQALAGAATADHPPARAVAPEKGNLEQKTGNSFVTATNPALPLDGALVMADVLRSQFNGLVVMIQNIPAGPPGPQGIQGIQGPPFATAIIDGVTTLPAGEQAWVTSFFDGTDVHFSFGIPMGFVGQTGDTGPQGPPFAQAVVDGVTTLPFGDPAWVTVGFDGAVVHFSFGIPQGEQGTSGGVTMAQLDGAISGTSSNTNAVSTLGLVVSDPPTQAEVQSLANKVDELILALRR